MPDAAARAARALSPAGRLRHLGRLCDALDALEDAVWEVVSFDLDAGSSADDLAAVVGCSRATLYRRVNAWRAFDLSHAETERPSA